MPSKFIQDKLEKIVNVDFESNIDKILKEHFKEYLNKGTKFSESYNLSTSSASRGLSRIGINYVNYVHVRGEELSRVSLSAPYLKEIFLILKTTSLFP